MIPALRCIQRIGVAAVLCMALLAGYGIRPVSATAASAPPSAASMAANMLRAMNSERAAHRLPPLRMNTLLIRSANRHNLQMARYNRMSHQLPGELFFLNRILLTGYRPSSAGEDVGWSSEWSMLAVYALQRMMYHEVAPNDGHRRNILSSSFRDVGIAIYLDAAHHKLWFTQDFGRPA